MEWTCQRSCKQLGKWYLGHLAAQLRLKCLDCAHFQGLTLQAESLCGINTVTVCISALCLADTEVVGRVSLLTLCGAFLRKEMSVVRKDVEYISIPFLCLLSLCLFCACPAPGQSCVAICSWSCLIVISVSHGQECRRRHMTVRNVCYLNSSVHPDMSPENF